MNEYEVCVWYCETRTIEACSAEEVSELACKEGWTRHKNLGGVHDVEIIKVNGEWTDPSTWKYSAQGE